MKEGKTNVIKKKRKIEMLKKLDKMMDETGKENRLKLFKKCTIISEVYSVE